MFDVTPCVLKLHVWDLTVSRPLLHQTETESRAETHGTGVRHNTKYNVFLLMQYRIRDPCIWYKHKRHLRFLSLFLKGYYHSTYYKSDAPSVKPINQITEHIGKKKEKKKNFLWQLLAFFFFFGYLWYSKKLVCHPSLAQKLESRKKTFQNEGKNKLYNQTKLAMYVFFCFFVFSFFLSIKVNVIVTLK